MSDTRDIAFVLEEAAAAAARGDYTAAEQQLRSAATLQEVQLGPGHPDLANTLNNIGVVCDLLAKPDDAELCYRRAFAIATAALEPTHEFVATSRRNLQEFYRARGRYTEAATLDVATSGRRGGRAEASSMTSSAGQGRESRPSAARPWTPPQAVALVAAVVALVTIVGWAGARFLPTPGPERPSTDRLTLPGGPEPTMAAERPAAPGRAFASDAPTAGSAPPEVPARVEPSETAAVAAAPPVSGERPTVALTPTGAAASVDRPRSTTAPEPRERREKAARGVAGETRLEVAAAEVCGTLSTPRAGGSWRCDPIAETDSGRTIFFYTRVRSPSSTKVQHRWYRDDALQRTVELTVGSSALEGYRTYSSQRLGKDAAGEWRVELRSAAGDVLHEARVMVR